MKPIKTIEQLVEFMDQATAQDHPKMLRQIDIPKETFDLYATWHELGYTRNCLGRTDDYELILICWPPGIKTPVHNHSQQHCWMYQISGKLKENRYSKPNGQLNLTQESELKQGQFTYMHDRMGFHSLENPGSDRAMSLHIYVAPITQCQVYNPEKRILETKTMQYDTAAKTLI
jgi:cysteine dioxygenase